MSILYFVSLPFLVTALRGVPPTTPVEQRSTSQLLGMDQPTGQLFALSPPVIEQTLSTYSPYDRVQFTGANAQGIEDPIKSTSIIGDLPTFAKPTPVPYSNTKIDLGPSPILDISQHMLVVGIPALDGVSIPSPLGEPANYPKLAKLKEYIDKSQLLT